MKQTITEQIYGSTDYARYAANGSGLFGTHTTLPLSLSKTANMRYFINFQGSSTIIVFLEANMK